MALSNSQYEFLMRTYEQKQLDNESRLRRRYENVYSRIPELEEIDHSISAFSVAQARRLLEGDGQALSSLKESIAELSARKIQLLKDNGYPDDYLELITRVRTARTPVTEARKNATALKRRSSTCCTHSLICRKYWKRKISQLSASIIIQVTTSIR